jgi:hypothetical protein
MLLCVVLNLLEQYVPVNYNENTNSVKIGIIEKSVIISTSSETLKIIENSINELTNYLKTNIINKQLLEEIYQEAINKNDYVFAKKFEPHGVYYNYLANIFANKLGNDAYWAPEVLAYALMYTYIQEYKKTFKNHDFINNYNFEEIISVYNKLNIKIKKDEAQKQNKKTWEIKTQIDAMYDLANMMIKNYINFKYKINIKRKSKKRK